MPAPQPALVVFVGHADCCWLGCLRAGFRHCFVALRDGSTWLTCDPLKDRIELSALPIPADFDLASIYADRGHTVLFGQTKPGLARRPLAFAPLTCVTVAKRLLGVRAPWVLTPWQLCRHLRADARGFVDVRPKADREAGQREATRCLTGSVNRTITLSPSAEPRPAAHPTTAPAGRSPRSQLAE
jgi:hypothetical protein